mmetsp:Transcript_8209/g.23346  ORF Transcript_8209/g.23346 Transcript_8209/m.23346 type:complete len:204 (-) Transcript_8209:390-1001(-)
MYERFVRISLLQGLPENRSGISAAFLGRARDLHVDAFENATCHGHEVRSEVHHQIILARCCSETLLNLRRMAVSSNTVSMDAFSDLAEQRALLGCAPSSSSARFGVNDDVLRRNQPLFEKGDSSQLCCCGVATRIGHEPCRANLFPGELGKAVDCLLLELHSLVLTVPLLIDPHIAETKVRGQVHDSDMLWKSLDDLLCCGVG